MLYEKAVGCKFNSLFYFILISSDALQRSLVQQKLNFLLLAFLNNLMISRRQSHYLKGKVYR